MRNPFQQRRSQPRPLSATEEHLLETDPQRLISKRPDLVILEMVPNEAGEYIPERIVLRR